MLAQQSTIQGLILSFIPYTGKKKLFKKYLTVKKEKTTTKKCKVRKNSKKYLETEKYFRPKIQKLK